MDGRKRADAIATDDIGRDRRARDGIHTGDGDEHNDDVAMEGGGE